MLSVEGLSKAYRQKSGAVLALEGVSFEVSEGEIVTVFGPNGSGKSTLFNILAGIEPYAEGKVRVGGKEPGEANVGFVFQNYNESLFPWLTVLGNVLFPLQVQKVGAAEAAARARRVLEKVSLWEHRDKYLYQLSGGMRQLVSVARAFVCDPELLLMDEPCSALDYVTTKKIELELLALWEDRRPTTVVVSHDVDEAVFLADRVIVLSPRPGKVKAVVPVDLPRPRTLDMLASERFFELRSEVLSQFTYA